MGHRIGRRPSAQPWAALATALLLPLLPAPPAAAVTVCGFDSLTGTALVTFGADDDVTVARSSDTITVNGAPCTTAINTATVANTDTIVFAGVGTGAEGVTIDLSGGAFAPGATAEAGGISEIEFSNLDLGPGSDTLTVVGGSGNESMVLAGSGIDLNGDGDSDVTPPPAGSFNAEAYSVLAGAGDDTVVASALVSPVSVEGSGGNDTLGGGEGNDDLSGGAGNDALSGGDADDLVSGGEGDDVLSGGEGDDVLRGETGLDTASYTLADAGVLLDLSVAALQDTGGAGSDSLDGIENLIGSGFADRLTGDAATNALSGAGGDDTLEGRAGDDMLDGGSGSDTSSYASAPSGVNVDIEAGTSRGGGGNDALTSIENTIGSASTDTLAGDEGSNAIDGNAGGDVLVGAGGDDVLTGGNGSDTVVYSGAPGPVVVDLAAGTATGEGVDALALVENVVGGRFDDLIAGSNAKNRLKGGAGSDTLLGRRGRDTLRGGAGNDRLTGSAGNDRLLGAAGDDQLLGGGGRDLCRAGRGIDTLRGCERRSG